MDQLLIGLIIMLITTFAARLISEAATRKLDQEQKSKLVDLFSKDRIFTFGALIVLIVLFVVSLRFKWAEPFIIYAIYFNCLLFYVLIISFSAFRKLKRNGFPDSYIQAYILATIIRLAGLIVFFAFVKI